MVHFNINRVIANFGTNLILLVLILQQDYLWTFLKVPIFVGHFCIRMHKFFILTVSDPVTSWKLTPLICLHKRDVIIMSVSIETEIKLFQRKEEVVGKKNFLMISGSYHLCFCVMKNKLPLSSLNSKCILCFSGKESSPSK